MSLEFVRSHQEQLTPLSNIDANPKFDMIPKLGKNLMTICATESML